MILFAHHLTAHQLWPRFFSSACSFLRHDRSPARNINKPKWGGRSRVKYANPMMPLGVKQHRQCGTTKCKQIILGSFKFSPPPLNLSDSICCKWRMLSIRELENLRINKNKALYTWCSSQSTRWIIIIRVNNLATFVVQHMVRSIFELAVTF